MGDVANQVQHEFWRPPMKTAASDAAAIQELSEVCRRCGTEFIVSSRFCHACGASRPELNAGSRIMEMPGLVELSALGERLGLTTASLIAFLVGTVCIVGALAVGVVFSARTLLDWQAIQIWRIEWLLGAIAAFVASRLLKKSS
jgi:thiamine monophosphate synthase